MSGPIKFLLNILTKGRKTKPTKTPTKGACKQTTEL